MRIDFSKGKKHMGQRPKEAGSSSQGLSPWPHTGHTCFSQQRDVTTHVKCCPPGTFVRDSVRFFWEAGHIGSFSLLHT